MQHNAQSAVLSSVKYFATRRDSMSIQLSGSLSRTRFRIVVLSVELVVSAILQRAGETVK